MKNLSLYGLGAVILILGIVYFNIPQAKANDVNETNVKSKSNKEELVQSLPKLPKLEEQNYKILNDRIVKLTKQVEILKNSSNANDEFEKLYQEVEKLKSQNEQLSLKNDELSNRLSNESLLVNENSKNSYEQMIDKLNEDLANYKSENDSLKLSLNDKENAVNNLNSLIGTLSNQRQMDEFEHDNLARKLQEELDKANAKIEANKKNYNDLVKENDVLKQRISNLGNLEKLNAELNESNNQLNIKNLDLTKEIKAASLLNTEFKKESDAKIVKLTLDNKNLAVKLDEANTNILKLNQQNDDLKVKADRVDSIIKERDNLQSEIFQAKLELEKFKNEQTKKIKDLSDSNKQSTDKLANELTKANNANKELKDINTKNEIAIKDLELKNKELNLDLSKKEKSLNELVNNNKKIEEELNKLKLNNEDLKAKVESNQKEKIELTAQINALNSDFLKYKNDSMNDKKSSIDELNNKLKESSKSYDDLNAKLISLQEDYNLKDLELQRFKNDNATLENEVEQLKTTIKNDTNGEKVIALEEEKEKLLKQLNDLNQKTLEKFNQENTELTAKKEKIAELEKKLELAQKESKLNTLNLKLQDTFICDDARAGIVNLSKSCTLGLDKFLAKYNENYLYEITPIIDNGGFKSLSAIDGVHMDSAEVQRLTRLANFGLSKDRTKSAASYIKSKVNNALVNLSLEPEYSKDNKKGFILRVYK